MIESILGWVGNLLFAIGAYGLAKKQVYGFQNQFLANLLYVVQSYLMNNTPLLFLSMGLGLFNLYGIWEWSKKEQPNISKIIKNQAESNYARTIADQFNYD
jgi:hypothetical protein